MAEHSEPIIVELDALPRPMFRAQVVVPMAVLLCILLIILLSAFWPSSPAGFVTQRPFATGVIAAAVAMPVALVARKLWARKTKQRRSELMGMRCELPIRERLVAILHSQQDYSDRETQVTSALAADGVGNVVALMGKSRQLSRSPIDVPFEPVPLDESAPAFRSLSPTCSAAREEAIARAQHPGPFELPPTWRRRLRLGAGWLAIGIFAFNLLLSSIRAWKIGKPTLEQMWWLGFLVLMVWGVGGFGAWRSTDQWLLVPGGVIRRSAKSRSSQWNLHLFTRTQAILLITDSRRSNRQVCVADGQQSATASVTPAEAELLLRAWLSPLPPPRIEQLGDLT
jgi:hypothetical protein